MHVTHYRVAFSSWGLSARVKRQRIVGIPLHSFPTGILNVLFMNLR